jgi:hypothetical protein
MRDPSAKKADVFSEFSSYITPTLLFTKFLPRFPYGIFLRFGWSFCSLRRRIRYGLHERSFFRVLLGHHLQLFLHSSPRKAPYVLKFRRGHCMIPSFLNGWRVVYRHGCSFGIAAGGFSLRSTRKPGNALRAAVYPNRYPLDRCPWLPNTLPVSPLCGPWPVAERINHATANASSNMSAAIVNRGGDG